MARFEVINNEHDAKMYSVVGTTSAGNADELVLNGMVGEIGARIEDNVYQLLPVTATAKDIFFVATPEVDADESKISNNTLIGFKNKIGEVQDAVVVTRNRKFAISQDGVEGLTGDAVKGGYLYVVAGKRKLQYKATAPVAGDNALLVAVIEDVVPATQGLFIGMNGTNLAMNYKMIRARVL